MLQRSLVQLLLYKISFGQITKVAHDLHLCTNDESKQKKTSKQKVKISQNYSIGRKNY